MFDKIQIIIIAILIPAGALYWYTNSKHISVMEIFYPGTSVMRVGDIPARVEIANTEAERIQGLSGRKEFGDKVNGMLFVFPNSDYHGIWMKDMNFPIDIIWINRDLVIVGIDKNVSPDSYPKTFRPSEPVQFILETDVHYADAFGIAPGQKVVLPKKYLED